MLETWKKKKLKELAIINYGKSPKEIIAEDGNVPILGTGGVERFGKDYLYDGESVILGRKGTIDKPNYINGKFWVIDTAYFLSGFNDANVKWLYYFLTTVDLRSMNEATGVPSLSRDFLYKLEIPTPPKDEQRQIAAILSCIDRVIDLTEALIAKQQRLRTGLMQKLLTKGIDEHGKLRSEATHEFKDSPWGRIPKEWEVRKLADLVKAPITYGIVQAGPHVEDGVPYIRTGDMSGDKLLAEGLLRTSQRIAASFKRSEVHTDEIVFALRATVGKVLEVPEELDGANLTQGTARIAPSNKLNGRFLLWAMRSRYFLDQIELSKKGTTFFEITLGDLRELKIRLPQNRFEQDEIARVLSLQENQIKCEKEQHRKLIRLKTGLMQNLLTGKIRVNALLETQSRTDG